jgi:hypothetical protein
MTRFWCEILSRIEPAKKTGCELRDSQPDDETRFRSKNYFGFFFDFFGVSLGAIVGSALVFA